MPIRTEKHITRQMLRDNPSWYFVFGDNLQRKGLGGQAAEMRGEPNAVGIPTKKAPSNAPGAFFGKWDLGEYQTGAATALARLHVHLRNGGTVVLPADGLGTGRARLAEKAPRVWGELQADLARLKAVAEFKGPDPAGRAALAREEGSDGKA